MYKHRVVKFFNCENLHLSRANMFIADLATKFRLGVSFLTPKKRCFFVIFAFVALGSMMLMRQSVKDWPHRLVEFAHTYTRSATVKPPTPYQTEIEKLINKIRQDVEKELEGFLFPLNTSPELLIPEKGGRPLRSIIVSTWRSGSTFLGDILKNVPGTMYQFEPFMDFGDSQMSGSKSNGKAIKRLKTLFACNYTALQGDYLKYGKTFPLQHEEMEHLWRNCMHKQKLCWDPQFLSPLCKLFPFQSVKIVRARLNVIEELLEDESSNVRVLLLVRDPRGTMKSRNPEEFCRSHPHCWNPSHLCAGLIEDHDSAVKFTIKFPKTFKIVRYEDLCLQHEKMSAEILEFLGFYMHSKVVAFLDTHTKRNQGDSMSTVRNTKWAAFHWQQDLPHGKVKEIQKACGPAMKLWGYALAKDKKHQKDFSPLEPSYQLPGMKRNN